ncbi:MAG: hypothetical protein Q9212_004841 [Teloschistes hypoglaucus]
MLFNLLYFRGALTVPVHGPVLTGAQLYTHTGEHPLECSIQTSYCGTPPSDNSVNPDWHPPHLPATIDSDDCHVTYTERNRTLVVPKITSISGSGAPCSAHNAMRFDTIYGPVQITFKDEGQGGLPDNPELSVNEGQVLVDSRNITKFFYGTNQNPYAGDLTMGHARPTQPDKLCRRWLFEIPCETGAPEQGRNRMRERVFSPSAEQGDGDGTTPDDTTPRGEIATTNGQ